MYFGKLGNIETYLARTSRRQIVVQQRGYLTSPVKGHVRVPSRNLGRIDNADTLQTVVASGSLPASIIAAKDHRTTGKLRHKRPNQADGHAAHRLRAHQA